MQLFPLILITVWKLYNSYQTNPYPLFIRQKKAIHIACHVRYLNHTSKMPNKIRFLKAPDIVHFNTCIFMYKAFHYLLPPSIQIYFSRSFTKKYYFHFYIHFSRMQRKKFYISRIGVSFWNALHTQIKLLSSLSSFKITLKNSVINTYINYR